MFLFGAGVLVAGSLLGGFATTDTLLIAARLVQGAGAAMLSPAAMSVILARFTGPAKVRAMSGWGAASTVGGAVGVTVGGLLTAALGWQSVLFVTGAVAAAIGVAGLGAPPRRKGSREAPVRRRRRDPAHRCGSRRRVRSAVGAAQRTHLAGGHRCDRVAVPCLIGFGLVERRAGTRSCPRGFSETPA